MKLAFSLAWGPGPGADLRGRFSLHSLSLKTFLGVGILTADATSYIPTPMSNFLNRNEMSRVKVSSRERDQRI